MYLYRRPSRTFQANADTTALVFRHITTVMNTEDAHLVMDEMLRYRTVDGIIGACNPLLFPSQQPNPKHGGKS